MKEIIKILQSFKTRGIHLSNDLSGENLSVKGKINSLTLEDKKLLSELKPSLLDFFQKQKSVHAKIPRLNETSGEFPLSPIQKNIWFHGEYEDNHQMYNIPYLYQSELVNFDFEIFKKALVELVKKHVLLNVVFNERKGIPYQKVTDFKILDHIVFNNYSSILEKEKHQLINKELNDLFRSKVDLKDKPAWKILVFQLDKTRFNFFICIHHLIADAVTIKNLFESLFDCFSEIEIEEKNRLNTIDYFDYLNWINDKSNFDTESDFWKKYLEGIPEKAKILNTPEVKTQHKETIHSVLISGEINKKIIAYCKSEKVLLTHLFTLVYSILLSKYTRENDQVIGMPCASRNHPQLNKLVGNLVNVLPLRVTLDYSLSVRDNLKALGHNFMNVLEHQTYPFSFILEDIGYIKRSADFPLFNYIIAFPFNQNLELADEQQTFLKEKSLYDFTCTVLDTPGEIQLELEYNNSIFTKRFVNNFGAYFISLLDTIIKNPEINLNQLQLDTRLSFDLNDGPSNVFDSLVKKVEKIAEKYRTKRAVISQEKILTYHELDKIVIQIAANLQSRNLKHGDRVLVHLTDLIFLPAIILGIWKAGGVYVPIAFDLPNERKNEIRNDCNPKIEINADFIAILDEVNYFSEIILTANDDAYIIYTSGSTGKPKGVVVNHAAIANKLEEESKFLDLTERMVTLTITSPSFDVSFLETILPLINGATVVVNKTFDFSTIANEIFANHVTHLQGTPTFFTSFLNEISQKEANDLNETLEVICCGGESMTSTLVKSIKNKWPKITLNNHYGPTEVTIDALVNKGITDFEENNIGTAIGKTKVYIVDEYLNQLPNELVGELIISGPSLASGYWNNTKVSNEKFMHLPNGQRVFKTGDLAAFTKQGTVKFIGRKDQQIKLRGYRIELEEISSRMTTLDFVQTAHVKVVRQTIVAWVVADKKRQEEIVAFLSKTLPEYMLPSVFEFLKALPMNINGKVDETKLYTSLSTQQEYIPPSDDLEKKLVELWQEILMSEKIGIQDNFFDLGGNSIHMTHLKFLYSNLFSVNLNLPQLFGKLTIQGHADYIRKGVGEKLNQIPVANKCQSYPLSSAQKRIFVLSQFQEIGVTYNIHETIILEESINKEMFSLAIDKLVTRHEILRTSFTFNHKKSEPEQLIKPIVALKDYFEYKDLSEHPGQINRLIELDLRTPFDLSLAPLFRIKLVKLEDQKYLLHYNLHHIIGDAWTVHLMYQEIRENYEHLVNQIDHSRGELPIQYKDYSVWQTMALKSRNYNNYRDYWLSRLANLPEITLLPLNKRRPDIRNYEGKGFFTWINKKDSRKIKEACKKENISLFTGLLSVWNILFFYYSECKDICLGTTVTGREHPELKGLLGVFTNTIVLRNKIEATNSFTAVLKKIKETLINDFEHQNYPFEELISSLKLKRDLSKNPLFDIMFTFQQIKTFVGDNNEEKEKGNIIESEAKTAKFDLEITMDESDDQLRLHLNYDLNIYEPEFIRQLTRHFKKALEQLLAEPEKPINEIDFLDEEEKEKIIRDFNETDLKFDESKTVIDLFKEQCRKRPNQIAINIQGKEYTYKELDEASNRISNMLIKEIGGAENPKVVLELKRNEGMVASILGVLKIGAAYIPTAPNYPDDRKKRIVKDSACVTQITEKNISESLTHSADLSATSVAPNQLAYITYTSGTTGTPKGVMINHKNVANLIQSQTHYFGINQTDQILLYTNYTFDAFVEQFFLALTNGATLHIIDENTQLDFHALSNYINDNKITHFHSVPSVISELLPLDYKYLKRIISGGDSCPYELSEKWQGKLAFYNEYGPTETTVTSTIYKFNSQKRNTIGRPIYNTQVYILNENHKLVPIGVKGRLFIAGKGVGLGYLNLNEETQKTFVPNPFIHGQKMYNTGDFAEWAPDGNIIYHGRKDDQIKLRGYRINLLEIESVTRLYSNKLDQVICVLNDTIDGLVLFVLNNPQISILELRIFLKKRLPHYMVPGHIVLKEEFPVNENGKIDRKKLAQIAITEAVKDKVIVKPSSQKERELIDIWKALLQIEKISVTDNFFDLGGTSIQLVKLFHELKKEYKTELLISDLFIQNNIKSLAVFLQGEETTGVMKKLDF